MDHFIKILQGYQTFRKKYALGDQSIMQSLSDNGQSPRVMVVSCCDSRVDPALILQCEPGDLFVVRNVANIVPPHEVDDHHHGTSAALEFGIRFLKVKHLILLGHSQCGGIQARLSGETFDNEYITNWVSLINKDRQLPTADDYAKQSLLQSHQNCLTFSWIQEEVSRKNLMIHLWYFDIKAGQILTYSKTEDTFQPLDSDNLLKI